MRMKEGRIGYLVLGLAGFYCCTSNTRETVREYYPDGKLKAELVLMEDRRDGHCRYYYPTGGLQYEGKFSAGRRIDKHVEYYEQAYNKPSKVLYYEAKDSVDVVTHYILYDTLGTPTFESRLCHRRLEIEEVNQPVGSRDTLTLKIRIVDAELPMTAAMVMNVDRYLNPLDTVLGSYFIGNDKHEVIVRMPLNEIKEKKLTGLAREFDIREINDTTGTAVACDTYFEYLAKTKDKSQRGS
jgi:hypothetical protein